MRPRFLTSGVMGALDALTWPAEAPADAAGRARNELPRVDVAARLRNLWA